MKRDLYGIEIAGTLAVIVAVARHSLYIIVLLKGERLADRAEGSVVTFAASIFLMTSGSGSYDFFGTGKHFADLSVKPRFNSSKTKCIYCELCFSQSTPIPTAR